MSSICRLVNVIIAYIFLEFRDNRNESFALLLKFVQENGLSIFILTVTAQLRHRVYVQDP